MLSEIIRLYTGIHALKPKSKLKTGAISNSTTTAGLNVDQTNSSAKCAADQKTAAPQLPSPLAPKPENGQCHPASMASSAETGSAAAAPTALKKEGGLNKFPADKKKIDARKKSLKRL